MMGLCILLFGGILLLGLWADVKGRKEKGLRRYRGIRWIERRWRKKQWIIPEWLQPHMIFRTWVLLLIGSGCLTLGGISGQWKQKAAVTELKRPEYGQGSRQTELSLEVEGEQGSKEKKDMMVEVGEKKLTEKEKQEMFRQIKKQLDRTILGENRSADQIQRPLYLPDMLENFPVSLQWVSSDPKIVNWEGKLGTDIPKDGTLVCLTAVISLEETEEKYFKYVKVYPERKTEQEELETLLKTANDNKTSPWMQLPDSLFGKKLSWEVNHEGELAGVALLVFFCPILLLMRDRQILQEKKKREKEQMIQDYPEILSKLTLLLGAGVNLRRAMERIGKDYIEGRKKGEERKAYEVILEICQEMERGVSEKKAYEELGEKCGILYYKTLSALLVQHLQKGSGDMGRILEEEAGKAQEIRRQQARILGEQASTKLLFPMILMLLVVFILLMVPAWLTFSI